MFSYVHPLLTQDAGRIKTDPINQQRISMVLDRYEEWARKNAADSQLKYNVDKNQLLKSMILFPLTGAVFGITCSYTFVHPNSKYIGKCFTAFTIFLGYLMHKRYQQAYNVSRYFGNYNAYPEDIQRMINNNDSRYAYKWLKDDYLSLEKENV